MIVDDGTGSGYRFEIGQNKIGVVSGGRLTPCIILARERYDTGEENYQVAYESDAKLTKGQIHIAWILSDDLMEIPCTPSG